MPSGGENDASQFMTRTLNRQKNRTMGSFRRYKAVREGRAFGSTGKPELLDWRYRGRMADRWEGSIGAVESALAPGGIEAMHW